MIGSAVCDALLARGDEVVGLSRDPERARGTNPTVTWHGWDPATERPPGRRVRRRRRRRQPRRRGDQPAAGPTRPSERIRDSRVRATKNLVDGMLRRRPDARGRWSASRAVGYYGEHGEAIVDESTAAGARLDSPGGASTGRRRRATAEQGGVRVAVLRTGLVLDPECGLLKQLLPIFKLGGGGPLAGGEQYMPWIHRDDEVALILWALDTDEVSGPVNAARRTRSPTGSSRRRSAGSFAAPRSRPPRAALVALRGAELTEQILASLRVVPRRALDLGYRFRFAELEPALRDLLRRDARDGLELACSRSIRVTAERRIALGCRRSRRRLPTRDRAGSAARSIAARTEAIAS